MYKEKNSAKASLLVIIFFVFLALTLNVVLGFIPVYQIIKDVTFMGVLVAFVLVFIKRYMSSYEYILEDEYMVFSTMLGDRERSRAEVGYGDIECFGKATDEKLAEYKAETCKFYADKSEKYAMIVNGEPGKVKIIFAPTPKLVEMINEKISTRAEEDK